jgi:hypothetical protein
MLKNDESIRTISTFCLTPSSSIGLEVADDIGIELAISGKVVLRCPARGYGTPLKISEGDSPGIPTQYIRSAFL